MKPKAFIRVDDGQRMSINKNGTYSWDFQKEDPEHHIFEYNLDLMESYVRTNNFKPEY